MLIDLVFLSNELLSPHVRHTLRTPLEFISFAFMEGKLYHHMQNKGTFVVPSNKRSWGNDVVYGALFILNDFHFHIRALDAYHSCSLSILHRNHTYDMHHRITTSITPITFQSVEEFCSLKYKEQPPIRAVAYVGNPTHPNIMRKTSSRKSNTRIIQGLDKMNFKELLREVLA